MQNQPKLCSLHIEFTIPISGNALALGRRGLRSDKGRQRQSWRCEGLPSSILIAKAHQRQKQPSQLYLHVFSPFANKLNYPRILYRSRVINARLTPEKLPRKHLPRGAIGVGMRFNAAFNGPRITAAGGYNKRRAEANRCRKNSAVARDESFMAE